jgi:hypothetical protein
MRKLVSVRCDGEGARVTHRHSGDLGRFVAVEDNFDADVVLNEKLCYDAMWARYPGFNRAVFVFSVVTAMEADDVSVVQEALWATTHIMRDAELRVLLLQIPFLVAGLVNVLKDAEGKVRLAVLQNLEFLARDVRRHCLFKAEDGSVLDGLVPGLVSVLDCGDTGAMKKGFWTLTHLHRSKSFVREINDNAGIAVQLFRMYELVDIPKLRWRVLGFLESLLCKSEKARAEFCRLPDIFGKLFSSFMDVEVLDHFNAMPITILTSLVSSSPEYKGEIKAIPGLMDKLASLQLSHEAVDSDFSMFPQELLAELRK